MRQITYREAIREALSEELKNDETVFLLGEDIEDPFGGSFKVTLGLKDNFGPNRVRNTPISETAIVGAALGSAMTGMRPVAEIMYVDFCGCAMDQIMNQVAKVRYMSGGQIDAPLVIRTQQGTGRSSAAQHAQSLEALFAHIPGLKVVMPATPYDAKGLLKAAIRDNDPVIFIEHKMLYNDVGEVPEEEYLIPLGKADIKRQGSDVTVVATSRMVQKALEAAKTLEKEGISVEVVDPRTIVPLDEQAILNSAKKTNRLVVVHEAVRRNGWGAEICRLIMEKVFDYLEAPVKIIAAANTPVPFSPCLERFVVPDVKDIVEGVKMFWIEALKTFDRKDKKNRSLYEDKAYKIIEANTLLDVGLYEEKVLNNGKTKKVKSKATLKQHVIITFSRKSMEYQRFIRNRQIERAKKILEKMDPDEYKKGPNDVTRFIKKAEKSDEKYELDLEKIREEEKYDGFYAIATNLDDCVKDILAINEQRYRIEDCFRILKTDFASRPYFHRTRERIIAHFMICYTALLIFRLLEVKLNRFDKSMHLTTRNIIETLQNMQVANISDICYAAQYTGSKTLSALEGVFILGLDKQYYLPRDLNKKCRKKFIDTVPMQHF
jgi:pyruvate/2-oxoglutarate/acetoin dehydrogenase E1 component